MTSAYTRRSSGEITSHDSPLLARVASRNRDLRRVRRLSNVRAITAVRRVVLVSPYELGRQPFALAAPAALLERAGFEVACLDLSLQKLADADWRGVVLIAVHVGMHTATRIALAALPHLQSLAPEARLCAYGLYGPMNASLLRACGVAEVIGGEFEPALLEAAKRAAAGVAPVATAPLIYRGKVAFAVPQRAGLPPLTRYAHLVLPGGEAKTVGFVEASRGCKHRCRHCPVVPVYQGRFRAVPEAIVLADIRQQVGQGAEHISFGDPDFLNGPTHALRIVRAMHSEFPALTWDATIKVQHLVEHAALLDELALSGCLFVTSAVESIDDAVLKRLAKNHTRAHFERAVALLAQTGIGFAPTFVAFTPWTTLEGYVELLETLARLGLVESVPPVQLAIRLLVPKGSELLKLEGFRALLDPFDAIMLGYPWHHRDPRVDALQCAVEARAARAEGEPRRETFAAIRRLTYKALGRLAPALARCASDRAIPHLSEPWYCCAEPTREQLATF